MAGGGTLIMRGRFSQFVAGADVADLAGVAVFATLVLGLIFGVLVPVAVHDRLAIGRHQAAVQLQQRANTLSAGIRAAAAELDKVKSQMAIAPERLRPASSLNERLAALVTLAGECGLTIQDLKPGDGVRRTKDFAVPVRVVGRGTYPDVTRLLHALHDRMADVSVDGFRVTAAGDYTLDVQWLAALPDAPAAIAVTSP